MISVRTRSFGRMLSMASGLLLFSAQCAQAQELRNLNNSFKSEAGCPIEVISAKTSLEMDPIGTPMACRIYIDYKNVSSKAISGVKFRIGYIDSEEKVRGSFHAPDGSALAPGGTASAKWRGERIDPRTASVMIRLLVARFSDGTLWESEKLKGLAPGTSGEGTMPGSGGGAAPSGVEPGAGGAASASPAGLEGSSAPAAGYGRPSASYTPSAGVGSGTGTGGTATASPGASAKSAAGDSFDSFEGGTNSSNGVSAGSSASSESSSGANSAPDKSATTPASSGSSGSSSPQSDKSNDGY